MEYIGYTEFNLTTWLRVVEITELNISKTFYIFDL